MGLPGRKMMRLLEDLNLTDQQEDMIVEMRREMRDKRGAFKQVRKESMETAMTELEKASPDKAKLHNLADQRIEGMRKMVHQGIDKFLALHATFSAEQRKTLTTRIRKLHERAARWDKD